MSVVKLDCMKKAQNISKAPLGVWALRKGWIRARTALSVGALDGLCWGRAFSLHFSGPPTSPQGVEPPKVGQKKPFFLKKNYLLTIYNIEGVPKRWYTEYLLQPLHTYQPRDASCYTQPYSLLNRGTLQGQQWQGAEIKEKYLLSRERAETKQDGQT